MTNYKLAIEIFDKMDKDTIDIMDWIKPNVLPHRKKIKKISTGRMKDIRPIAKPKEPNSQITGQTVSKITSSNFDNLNLTHL